MKVRNQRKSALLALVAGLPLIAKGQIDSGLIGYWQFESNLTETSGAHAAGLHDGSEEGVVAYTAGPSAAFGQALDLDGSNGVKVNNTSDTEAGYVGTFDADINTAEALSISFWSSGAPGTWSPVIAKHGEGTQGFQVRRRSSSLEATYTLRGTDGADDPTAGNLAFSNQPTWNHYVAVWDGTNGGTRTLYINGVQDTSFSASPDAISDVLAGGPGNATPYFLTFGMRDNTTGLGNFLTGQIDDVAIWNRPLTATEAGQLFSFPLSVIVTATDSDGDGLFDNDEINIHMTNPNNPDSDGDGANDFDEVFKGSNPNLDDDFDGDGLMTSEETSGSRNPWTGMTSGATPGDDTEWFDADSDNDGLTDGEELLTSMGSTFITNPNEADSDGDGHNDQVELDASPVSDPTDPASVPTLDTCLIGYWEFEGDLTETSGAHSGGVHDGETFNEDFGFQEPDYVGGPSANFGQAISLDGTNGVYVLGSSTIVPSEYLPTFDADVNAAGGLSISFWANGFPGNWNPFVAKYGEGGEGWQVRRRSSENNAVFTIRSTDGEDDPTDGTNGAGALSTWVHYVATWDASGTRRIYVNGVEDAVLTQTNDLTAGANGGPGNADVFDLTFGMRHDGISYDNFFVGEIDDVAIWKRSLTPDEVAALGSNTVATLVNGFVDTDGDLLSNDDEINIFGTDPNKADTDDDGVDDRAEILKGSDALNDNDFDNDGLLNSAETSGSSNPWTGTTLGTPDGDMTDWCDADSDNDGIEDGEEVVAGVDDFVTNPNDADTDDDGFTDRAEVNSITAGDPTDEQVGLTEWERDMCGYWQFDGDLTDSGFLEADGVMGGLAATETYATGQFGSAIDLDKLNEQRVEISGDESAFDAPGSSLTVSAWVQVEDFDQSWQAVIAKGEGDSWRIAQRKSLGGMSFASGSIGDNPTDDATAAANAIDDGQWHHLVGVAEAGVGSRFWLDGVLISNVDDAASVIADSTEPLFIGGNSATPTDAGGAFRTWNGNIDDVVVWKRALSPEEIYEVFSNGNDLEYLITNNVVPGPIPEGEVVIDSCGFNGSGGFDVVVSGLTVGRSYQMMSSVLLDGTDWMNVGATFTGGTMNTFTDVAPPSGASAKIFYQIFDVDP